jgi:hypothetical protein
MQNLLSLMQTTGYSIANLGALAGLSPQQLIATLLADLMQLLSGTGSSTQDLNTLLGALGAGGTANAAVSSSAFDQVATAAYNSRASFGYGAYRGANL